jgi:hypothetical protein
MSYPKPAVKSASVGFGKVAAITVFFFAGVAVSYSPHSPKELPDKS